MSAILLSTKAELKKMVRSRVFYATIAALSLAPLFGALFVVVLRDPALSQGNDALLAKARLTGFGPDWPSYLNLIAQAVGVGGLVVFGFAAGWIVGREFSDGTMKDLLTLPVSRTTLVLSKTAAFLVWCLALVVSVLAVALVAGTLLQLPDGGTEVIFASLRKILATTLLTCTITLPVLYVASVGKGFMAPLGFVVLSVVVSQIVGALGLGSYFPWAIPALYSGIGPETARDVNVTGISLLLLTGGAGLFATLLHWNRSDII